MIRVGLLDVFVIVLVSTLSPHWLGLMLIFPLALATEGIAAPHLGRGGFQMSCLGVGIGLQVRNVAVDLADEGIE